MSAHTLRRVACGLALALLVSTASAQDAASSREKRAKHRGNATAKAPEVEILTPTASARAAQAQARKKVRVVLYSTSWCGVCKTARRYLKSRGIPFVEHDVERDAAARERYLALNPAGGVPTIAIDQAVLVGFAARAIEKAVDAAAAARVTEQAARGPRTFEVHWDERSR